MQSKGDIVHQHNTSLSKTENHIAATDVNIDEYL